MSDIVVGVLILGIGVGILLCLFSAAIFVGHLISGMLNDGNVSQILNTDDEEGE